MASRMSALDLDRALASCNSQPVHAPGHIQDFGCLVACHCQTGIISYVSENFEKFWDIDPSSVLGMQLLDVFGKEIVHKINNAASSREVSVKSIHAGHFERQGKAFSFRVCKSGDYFIVDVEAAEAHKLVSAEGLNSLNFIVNRIEGCASQADLLDVTAELMQHISGYDHVMVYKFDAEGHGSVLAEARNQSRESFLGLRFPGWDIPPQARAIMKRHPLRMIYDVDLEPVPLMSNVPQPEDLDLTFSTLRGVAPVHLEYLRNMGSQATLTLSVVVEDELWGMISFHHSTPRACSADIRDIILSALPIFAGKLLQLQLKEAVNRISAMDSHLELRSDEELELDEALASLADKVLTLSNTQGFVSMSDSQISGFGHVPETPLLHQILQFAMSQDADIIDIGNLTEAFPDHASYLNSSAGVLMAKVHPRRLLCLFRDEVRYTVNWAGNPQKMYDCDDGELRLSPRKLFGSYLEIVKNRCDDWTEADRDLLRYIRTVVHSIEREALLRNKLNRQQSLMIDELNHRVRNILDLVRSVSGQARRHNGSLDSYANAMEERIQALAAAHDLASATWVGTSSLHAYILQELAPYSPENTGQIRLSGPDRRLRADVAPVFTLVIHELATNAVKYGALSVPEGRVEISITETEDWVTIHWVELDGPKVESLRRNGFGSTLIKHAIPHELQGKAELTFDPDGVKATLSLPTDIVGERVKSADQDKQQIAKSPKKMQAELPQEVLEGTGLLVENNFVIATELKDQLLDHGFRDIAVFSDPEAALDFIETTPVKIALLDVNLGNGQTSEGIAMKLIEQGVPTLFVTGYGERAMLHPSLSVVPRISKPVSPQLLGTFMMQLCTTDSDVA